MHSVWREIFAAFQADPRRLWLSNMFSPMDSDSPFFFSKHTHTHTPATWFMLPCVNVTHQMLEIAETYLAEDDEHKSFVIFHQLCGLHGGKGSSWGASHCSQIMPHRGISTEAASFRFLWVNKLNSLCVHLKRQVFRKLLWNANTQLPSAHANDDRQVSSSNGSCQGTWPYPGSCRAESAAWTNMSFEFAVTACMFNWG